MVHLYTFPSSVPIKNIVSSLGLKAIHRPPSESYRVGCFCTIPIYRGKMLIIMRAVFVISLKYYYYPSEIVLCPESNCIVVW